MLAASRRLAHWLSTSFAEHAQAQGRVVWPTPQVLPWSAFIRNACREQRSARVDSPRLLSELQALALWERIVSDSAIGRQLLNPAQAARNAARSWQRLHEYRMPLKAVAAYPTDEAQAFAAWAQQFLQHTQQYNWLDGARFCSWLASSDYVPPQPLALMGFDQLTPEMEQLIAFWRERGAEVTILAAPSRSVTVQVIAATDANNELDLAARWARHQLQQSAPRIAIVVPQLATRISDVERVVARVFNPAASCGGAEPAANAFTIAASSVLSAYPLVHHALLCLQLAQSKADTLLIGQLLRSPFLLGYEQEAATRALADITAREERREHWDAGELARFAAANACPQLSTAMLAANPFIHDHRDAALPSRWTERFSTLLQRMGWAQGRTLNSAEQQTRVKFYEVLAELSALDELLGRLTFQQALSVLRDACNAERFAPESSEQRVTIIDADTVAGMEFDALWVMGLHAGEWPPAIDPDPLLPIELQRQYRMPDAIAAQRLQTARRKLERLVQSAKSVVLSWPQHDEDAELRASPLLAAWQAIDATALSVSTVPSAAQQLFLQRPMLESFTDNYAPPVTATQIKGGAQIFELQSRCAFRAQAQLRLHAEPVPSVSLAIEPIERGILIHRVLGEVWSELKGSEGLHDALSEMLSESALSLSLPPATGEGDKNAFAASSQSSLLSPQAGEGRAGGALNFATGNSILTQRIRSIAERTAQQLIPITTAHRQRLVALEVELAVQWVTSLLQVEAQRPPFTVRRAEEREVFKFADLNITIQLDRIDELRDGSSLLIDYKTGDANKPSDWLDVAYPGRPRSPQLPLYALAHRERLSGIAFAVLAPGKAEFRGLANTAELQSVGIRDYASSKPNTKPADIDTWNDLIAHWEVVLGTLGQQFLAGAAAVDPLRNECDYCHLAGLCRIAELSGAHGGDESAEGSDD